ncbi:MAG: UPF0104 family protein [Chloroflexi bacterium]|nr:MAG: UPF0104 family protein [Chloroflexota bacterium]
MRRIIFLLVSLLVSAVFLWLALRGVPLADVWDSIQQANVLWIGVSFGSITIGLWTRSVRWRGLLDDKISPMQAFHIVNITFLVNQLPFRAGEIARSLLARRAGVPVMTAATSILVERLLDTLLVVIFLAVALSRVPQVPDAASQVTVLFGIAAVVVFIVLLFFARRPHIAHNILTWLEDRIPVMQRLPFSRLLTHIVEGLQPLTNWHRFAHAVGWTLISWLFSFVTLYSLILALGIDDVDRVLTSVLGVTLASFSIAIPVSVAAIGPFEGALRVAGEAVNMSSELALSLGFLLHGMTVIGYAIWGIIGLLNQGVSFSETLKFGQQQSALQEEATISPTADAN